LCIAYCFGANCIEDISYTDAPRTIQILPGFFHDPHCSFWSLAALAFPEGRNTNLQEPQPSPKYNYVSPPDEHLLCYDYLYYVSALRVRSFITCHTETYFTTNEQSPQVEYENDYSPAWRFVVQHMRWEPQLEALASTYLRATIGVPDDDPIPPVRFPNSLFSFHYCSLVS
jgi:hypothetical protein